MRETREHDNERPFCTLQKSPQCSANVSLGNWAVMTLKSPWGFQGT